MPGITLKAVAVFGCSFAIFNSFVQLDLEKNLSFESFQNRLLELGSANLTEVVAAISEEDLAYKLVGEAQSLKAKNKSNEALAIYSKLIQKNISKELTWQARLERSKLFEEEKKLDEAVYELSAFIKSCPPGIHKTLAYSYRADLYEKMGHNGQALLDRDMIASLR